MDLGEPRPCDLRSLCPERLRSQLEYTRIRVSTERQALCLLVPRDRLDGSLAMRSGYSVVQAGGALLLAQYFHNA